MAQRFTLFLTEIQGKKGKGNIPGDSAKSFSKECVSSPSCAEKAPLRLNLRFLANIAHIKWSKEENDTDFSGTYQKFFG